MPAQKEEPKATRRSLPLGLLALSLAVGISSLFFEQPRHLFSSVLQRTGIHSPSPPVVYDAAREVTYVGVSTPGVEHFHNIFYAQDTSGANRFAPPVPLVHAKGAVIDATTPGAWCPQGLGDILPFTSRVTNISENCLSLTVARPAGTRAGAQLPVLVYIHGGGHALGSAADAFYAPDGLVAQAAADAQPVLYVGINYRVGVFGFAASPGLRAARHTNAGLRDQRAALDWVAAHIGPFGGDARRVTAVGQSVGAADIGLHLTAHGGAAPAPFAAAVMMSGGPGFLFDMGADAVRARTAGVAAALGCALDGSDDDGGVAACLRAAPLAALANASVGAMRAAHPPFGEAFFTPTVDGDYVPDVPSALLRAGRVARGVRLVASWVANDGAWYPAPGTASPADVAAGLRAYMPGLSDATLARLLALYPAGAFADAAAGTGASAQYFRAAQMQRDLWFACPVLDFAGQYARHGGVAGGVRLYEANATRFAPVLAGMGVPEWRVVHLSDVPYVFASERVGGGADNSAEQRALGRLLSASLVRFATAGTPEGSRSGVAEWPPAFGDGLEVEGAPAFTIKLFGGPHGTQTVAVGGRTSGEDMSDAERALAAERLVERCAFINSDEVRRELGV